ncbi:MFS transporter [Thermolongibacillus altinsuensis]|uniref:MFS transporter n=1 Tax=Thermolongibacillus altinsuensis TaxID=575256 RepID=UPI00242A2BB0|nr:MFS transporter [Thermolongibacillus altinsuensis]GMB09846.1 putative transporter YwbF [Thermolongibacillus altinsuensis]
MNRSKYVFQAFYFLMFFSFGSLFPLLSVYLKEVVGLSGTEIGMIMSISPIVMIFIQPLWGMVSDYTQKPVLILSISLIGTALFGLLYSFAHSYVPLLVIAALLAVMQSGIVPLSDSITLHYVQKANENYGSIRLWGAIGFAVAVPIAGQLAEWFQLRFIFYLFFLLLLVSSLLAWKLPKEQSNTKANIRQGIRELARIPSFLLFLFTTFLVFGPIYANNFYFGVLITDLGGTLAGVGFAFLLAAGSEAPFMKFADSIIRRYGMMNVLLIASILACLRWLLYFFEPPLSVVYATTIVQGASVGLFIPAALQYVRDLTPEHVRTTAVSLYSTVGNGLGSWFCTFVGGYIFEHFSIEHVYLFFAVLTLAGIIIFAWQARKNRCHVKMKFDTIRK